MTRTITVNRSSIFRSGRPKTLPNCLFYRNHFIQEESEPSLYLPTFLTYLLLDLSSVPVGTIYVPTAQHVQP
jgi:hypothetical protein